MATRHLMLRGIRAIRPTSSWMLCRSNGMQATVSMATVQPSATHQAREHRSFLWANQSALFHSSRRLLDENHIIIQDEEDFKEKVIGSESVIVVDFHAEWCNPCKALAPILEAVIDDTKGQIKLAKVDIDDLQDLAINYRVSSVPTVMAFKGGVEVGKFIGLKSPQDLQAFVEKLLT